MENLGIVKALLDAGADPNAVSETSSPLTMALDRRHVEVIDLLLERGADPNGSGRRNAMALAIRMGWSAMAEKLLAAGANPMMTTSRKERIAVEAKMEADGFSYFSGVGAWFPLREAAADGMWELATRMVATMAERGELDELGRLSGGDALGKAVFPSHKESAKRLDEAARMVGLKIKLKSSTSESVGAVRKARKI